MRAISFSILRLLLLVADEEQGESDAFVLAAWVWRTLADSDALGDELLAFISPRLIHCTETFVAAGDLAGGAAATAVTAATAVAAGA